MSNRYKFYNYIESFLTNYLNNKPAEFIDLSLGFSHLTPKIFEVPNIYSDDDKDSYYVNFYCTLRFSLINNELKFEKFRFEIFGDETKSRDSINFTTFSNDLTFSDFIKMEYIKFVEKNKNLTFNKITYQFQEKDYQTIYEEGIKNLAKIFPNPKDIFIINEPTADFYKSERFNEGIYIYEKLNTLLIMQNITDKLSSKTSPPSSSKKIKI